MSWLVLLLALAFGAIAPPVRADSPSDTELCAMGADGRASATEAIAACNRALQPGWLTSNPVTRRLLGGSELTPQDQSSILFNLANIHFRSGSLSQAASAVDSSIRLDPNNARAYQLRAQLATKRQDYRDAIKDYSTAIQLEPGSTSAYLGRAYAFSVSKQYAAAKDDYERVLRREPGNSAALAGRDAVDARLRAMQADAPPGGNDNPVDEIARALGSPPPSTPPQAAPPAPPRQAAEAPPAPAAPLGAAPLEGTEARQQAINSQVQQGLAALGYKVARTDGKIDGSTREAIRRFASQQKVKAPETPDDDFLSLIDQAREAKGLAVGPPSDQAVPPPTAQAEVDDPAKKARVLRAQKALNDLGLLAPKPTGNLASQTRAALVKAKIPFTDSDIDESAVEQLEARAQAAREDRAAQALAAKEREKAAPPPTMARKEPTPQETTPPAPPSRQPQQTPTPSADIPRQQQLAEAGETRKIPPTASQDVQPLAIVPPPAPVLPKEPPAAQIPPSSKSPLVIPDLSTGDADRVALVIGNGGYQHLPALRNPPNDAADMRALLERVGFRVFYGADLGRDDMDKLTINFSRAARRAKVAFSFYAGHGVQVDGTNYLIPVDALIEDEANLRQMFRLDDMIRDAAGAQQLGVVAVDACRDNPFAGQVTTDKAAGGQTRSLASLAKGLAAPVAPPNTLIVYATSATSTAEDGFGRNSPFTAAMLRNLDEARDVRLVFGDVAADVSKTTHNQQWPNTWGSVGGEVSLVRPEAAAQALESQLSGVERAAIQRSLVRLGLLPSAEGGDAFGQAIRTAISSFQRSRGEQAIGYLTADQTVALHHDARVHGLPQPLPPHEFLKVFRNAQGESPDRGAMLTLARILDPAFQEDTLPKSLRDAADWYRKAAAAGDPDAAMRLAKILEDGGNGVPPNPAEAVRLLKGAAGSADAEYELGRLYLDGKGVPKNQDDAVRHFRLAMKSGSGEATAELRALRVPIDSQVSGR